MVDGQSSSGQHGADRAGWGFSPSHLHNLLARRRTERAICTPKFGAATNYARYNELKDVADELLQKEVRNGYVQWCAGTLHLAKIAVVVKGTKVRLIHDLRKNGTNARVTFRERLVLPRVKDLISGWSSSRLIYGTLSSSSTWSHRNRPFLAGASMDGLFSYGTVLFGVG